MKSNGFKFLALAAIAAATTLTSCQRTDLPKEKIEISAMEIENPYSDDLNPQVAKFYSNLSFIISATRPVLTKAGDLEYTAEYFLDHEEDFPVEAKLASMEIEFDDGTTGTYFDLPINQQELFIAAITADEAGTLSDKLEIVPELEEYITAQNAVIDEVLNEYEVDTKSTSAEIADYRGFYSRLSSKMADMSLSFKFSADAAITKGSGKKNNGENPYEVPADSVKNRLAGLAVRGDIILALPKHDNYYIVINRNNPYLVGHTEIFTEDITETTKTGERTTVGAWEGAGVQRRTLDDWGRKCYLLGVCQKKRVWNKKQHKYILTQTPVSNPAAMADEAEKHIGKPYLERGSFGVAKWYAPKKFICTTLVWYSAKQAYKIKISPWLSNMVTPAEIMRDANVYVKVNITE